ncbi:START domain protein [Ancylostoma caninum]|uniref:START domain protein n=1 Tax=Ancylostoma caninum TaxID=29170 RepID=A0A368F8I8_ANCCA|nr:START domain protein [Ancylostoma caninum]
MASLDAVAVGDEAIKDLLALVDGGEEGWKELWTDDGIVFHTRKGVEPCLVDIIRCRFILEDTDLATVKAMVTPWLPYRIQWDDIMQRCELVEELDKGYRLVHHVTKKRFPLSPRDSVDVVSTHFEPNRVVMSARSVPTAGPAPTADIVRTYQHLGGYCIAVSGEREFLFTEPRYISAHLSGFVHGCIIIPEKEVEEKRQAQES